MNKLLYCGLICAAIVTVPRVEGAGRVSVRVSPAVALAPAKLVVRTTVEPNDDNRRLIVTLESSNYVRSSEIPLEGRDGQKLSVLELRQVPTGLYEVRARLFGTRGPVADSVQLVKVEPSPGHAN
jgi:hypothetical protein